MKTYWCCRTLAAMPSHKLRWSGCLIGLVTENNTAVCSDLCHSSMLNQLFQYASAEGCMSRSDRGSSVRSKLVNILVQNSCAEVCCMITTTISLLGVYRKV